MSITICLVLIISTGQAFADKNKKEERLDALFTELAKPTNGLNAGTLEREILALWLDADSDSTSYLMDKGMQAMMLGDKETALDMFTVVTKSDPDYAEGWNKRATILYELGQYSESVEDIQKVLDLEPRHFGALAGLGMIFMELDNMEGALEAYRRALRVHPHLSGVRAMIKRLKPLVEGQDI